MVGDNIRTDVTGARALGMPALWLANGIDRGALMTAHGIDLQQATAMAAARGLSDILLMAQLR
jgi:ribonucleotide monophosphatase NagD (HAD superfamily)